MSGLEAIAAIGEAGVAAPAMHLAPAPTETPQLAQASFGELMMAGLRSVDAKLASADQLVHQFALDDSVPVHQVTMALEEARLSVELAMQVRARLVEGYRELMNMQL